MSGSTAPRYSRPLIALHWITLLLVAAAYALMEFKGIFPKGSAERDLMKNIHYSVGVTLLGLTALRLALRWVAGAAPAIVPEPPRWQQAAGHAMHLALYAMLIVLPVTGWLTMNGHGVSISAWGVPLPTLIGTDKALAGNLKDIHESIALAGYGLIGLHAMAALYHHYVARDNTLRRMLPGKTAA
ncbi:cytochrome b [Castellaniella sp. GW247-6E4]|uniref:cytochrome b n=1 Tax=Castellaniella sp. GW247-6E4 TaxID=3140380 RepID=UPI0033150317